MVEKTQEILYGAGRLIRELIKEDLNIETKSRNDWVTNIDKQVEAYLVENLIEEFPNTNFLTEENTVETKELDRLWIIDPIDGTTNLIFQKQNFAISLAFVENGEPSFGFVYDVMRDILYKGIKDDGIYINDLRQDVALDQEETIDNQLMFGDISSPHMFKKTPSEIKEIIATYRFSGSGALEVTYIALNYGSAYVYPFLKIWDIAAAVLLLELAGGTWSFDGIEKYYPLDNEPRKFISAQNKIILDTIQSWT